MFGRFDDDPEECLVICVAREQPRIAGPAVHYVIDQSAGNLSRASGASTHPTNGGGK